jgi:protein TonB
MVRMLSRFLCKLALIYALPISLFGQSTADGIQTRLIGKPLYLRGLWKDNKLHFDSAGKLRGNSQTLSFTLCGIEVTKVDIQPKRLVIDGRRVGLKFNNSVPQRIVLVAGSTQGSHDEQMHVEIDAPPGGDYSPALDAIFTDDLASLLPALPAEWQNYATKNFPAGSPPSSPQTELPPLPQGMRRVGGGVSPPRKLSGAEPRLNEYAGAMRATGTDYIFLVIDQKGNPSQPSIVRPIGLGLDEDALAAVKQYVFQPATEGGKPVAVGIVVEIRSTQF